MRIDPRSNSGWVIHARLIRPVPPVTRAISATISHTWAMATCSTATVRVSRPSVWARGVPETSESTSGIINNAISPKQMAATAPVREARCPSTLNEAWCRRS